jgi:transcriptional regulator with XRE-family HTH domain
MITPIQTIKARQVTRMTEADLSAASGVSQKAIEEFEAAKRSLNATTVQALRTALKSRLGSGERQPVDPHARHHDRSARQGFGDQSSNARMIELPRNGLLTAMTGESTPRLSKRPGRFLVRSGHHESTC